MLQSRHLKFWPTWHICFIGIIAIHFIFSPKQCLHIGFIQIVSSCYNPELLVTACAYVLVLSCLIIFIELFKHRPGSQPIVPVRVRIGLFSDSGSWSKSWNLTGFRQRILSELSKFRLDFKVRCWKIIELSSCPYSLLHLLPLSHSLLWRSPEGQPHFRGRQSMYMLSSSGSLGPASPDR